MKMLSEEELEIIENEIMEIVDSKLKPMCKSDQYVLVEMLSDSLETREREIKS